MQPGDRIAVQAPKTQIMLELYVATVLCGAVFLPLNTGYTASELRYFLGDAQPRLLVCDPRRAADLRAVADDCGVSDVLTIGVDESGTLADLRDAHQPGFAPVARAAGSVEACELK